MNTENSIKEANNDFLIDKFVALLNVVNQFFARLTGASVFTKAKKYATNYSDAIGTAGSTAKKAAKEIRDATIGIDELNIISQPDPNTGSGGGGGGSTHDGMDTWKVQFVTDDDGVLPYWVNITFFVNAHITDEYYDIITVTGAVTMYYEDETVCYVPASEGGVLVSSFQNEEEETIPNVTIISGDATMSHGHVEINGDCTLKLTYNSQT